MLQPHSFSLPRVLMGPLTGVLLGGLSLTSCSSPQQSGTDPDAAPGVSLFAPGGRSTGDRVDSLNGIPGHHFGEPLSAFPGITLSDMSDNKDNPRYEYPVGVDMGGWWEKQRKKEGSFIKGFYSFPNGRFACFMVEASGTAVSKLLPEAEFLFGPGAKDADGVSWVGAKSEAHYVSFRGTVSPWLIVQTHEYAQQLTAENAARAKDERAKLDAEIKAEN